MFNYMMCDQSCLYYTNRLLCHARRVKRKEVPCFRCYLFLLCLLNLSRHGVEVNKLMNEMESQKELLLTYEQT